MGQNFSQQNANEAFEGMGKAFDESMKECKENEKICQRSFKLLYFARRNPE